MSILLQALIMFFIKDTIINFSLYSFFLIIINFVIISLYLFKNLKNNILIMIYLGFVARILIMLIDLYVPSVNILGSGSDTEYFHSASINIANGIMPLSEGRTYYVNVLSGLYYLFGDQRLLAQFLNITFWLFAAIYLYKSLLLFEVHRKITLLSLLIFIILPNGMFMSSILLRESIIVFFITLSLYYFSKWLKLKVIKDYIFAILLALAAMLFHAGMVGFLIGYIFAFIFNTQRKEGKRTNRIAYLLLITAILVLLFSNDDLFLSKFNSLQDGGVENLSISNKGGSAYLQGFSNYSSWQVFLLTPLKMVYFLFSPLPMDWRGVNDIISFLFDSIFYIFLFICITIGITKSSLDKKMKITILIMLLICTFIYSYGTGNAGTAIRHRYKLMPLFLLAYGLLSKRQKYKRT